MENACNTVSTFYYFISVIIGRFALTINETKIESSSSVEILDKPGHKITKSTNNEVWKTKRDASGL